MSSPGGRRSWRRRCTCRHSWAWITATGCAPGHRAIVSVHVESQRGDALAFDATLALRRRELTPRAAASVTRRYPLASARVLALIYGHALGLKFAGATVYRHPEAT